jgi:hypothetical protein
MRALLAALLLTPVLALADSGPLADTVEATPEFAVPHLVANPDQERLFNQVEVYRLDPGTYRAELRYSSGAYGTVPTLQVRAEAGLTDHFQLGLAEDTAFAFGHGPQLAATHLALRYALGAAPGALFGNPAVEAELIPRSHAPARAALRLLLAQEVMPRLVLAVNGYLEQNVERSTSAGVDGAFGMTSGLSYDLLPGFLRVGGEARLGEAQYAFPDYHLAVVMGPSVVLHHGAFAATASVLLDLAQSHVGLQPALTVGTTF